MSRLVTVAVLIAVVGSAGCADDPVQDVPSVAPDAPLAEQISPEGSDVDGAWGLPLKGRFTYMADAAVFEYCATDRRLPVAMEADYLSLERAYLESRSEPGAPLLVVLVGHIEERPSMEGDNLVEMLVIDRFNAALPGEECEETAGTDSG